VRAGSVDMAAPGSYRVPFVGLVNVGSTNDINHWCDQQIPLDSPP
jgi:hypothetical protein